MGTVRAREQRELRGRGGGRGREGPGCTVAEGGGDAGQKEEGRRMLQIVMRNRARQPIIALL